MSEVMRAYLDGLQRSTDKGNLALQLYRRSADNPDSLLFAVHARCVQCSNGTDEDGWQEAVRNCKAFSCSLNAIRPYQESDGKRVSRRKAINAYCWQCMGGRNDGRSGTNGNVRRLIHECGTESCFIHSIRPYRDWGTEQDGSDSVTAALGLALSVRGEDIEPKTIEETTQELAIA